MRQIAHLDMDAFFVAVERARDPGLRGRPVIVGGRPGGRGVVAAASYEAREFGVHSAMPVAEAVARCPHATFVEGSFERYLEASAAVDDVVRRYAPRIEWVSIDEAYLDLSGTERALGHALRTTERIQLEIRSELRLDASAGVGSSKVVAKIAAHLAKPRGLLYVLPGYESRFLAPLRIELLPGIGPQAARRLHEIGVTTLGELAALPADVLQQRLGRIGSILARHATGVDDSPVIGASAPRSISRETTLDTDTNNVDRLVSLLQYLAERATYRLRSDGLFARTVSVKVRYSDFTTETRARSLREATSLDADLLPVARTLFLRLLRPQRTVRLIGVSLSGLIDDGRQLSLFPTRSGDERDARGPDAAMKDRVRERYGFDALLSGTALPIGRSATRGKK